MSGRLALFSLLIALTVGQSSIGQPYDYVIVGAGTAGLLLATILSENPAISVIVLEAGADSRADSNVTDPERRGTLQHTQYDWGFESTLQPGLHDNGTGGSQYVPRGKTIGGTSAMNWMIHNENSRVQLDIWEDSLNLTGWKWESMSTAFRESETMYAPPAALAASLPYNAALHGGNGPIASTLQRSVYTLYSDYVSPTLVARGFDPTHDGNDGNANGPNFLPLAILPANYTRSYAGSVYSRVEDRQNLDVRTNCQVTGITWASKGTKATASGVEYISTNSSRDQPVQVLAREIILSAGAIQSSQILELSGVGDPAILTSLGINMTVDLYSVGTSLRDPPMTNYWPIQFNIDPSIHFTGNEYIQNFIDLEPASKILSPVDYAAASVWLNSTASIPGLAQAQFDVFKELWYSEQPLIEFAWQYQVANVTPYCLVPLSQGTVHINSTDPLHPPAINPNYNTVNATINGETVAWDMWFLAKASQYYTVLLATSEPMSSIITSTNPPYNASFEDWYDAIYRQTGSSQHLTGGNPMLAHEAGGVVDTELLVYGTNNVRVVDGSVFPYQPSAHPMGLTYALAVRAARILQGSSGGGGYTKTTEFPDSNSSATATASFDNGNATASATGDISFTGAAEHMKRKRVGYKAFAVFLLGMILFL